jgi:chromosome segregation ATPase
MLTWLVVWNFVKSVLLNPFVIGAILLFSAYLYVQHLNTRIDTLTAENQKLVLTVKNQEKMLGDMKQQHEQSTANYNELLKKMEELKKSEAKLEETLYREREANKKSLEELSIAKTSLVQSKINAATDKVFYCFRVAMGEKNEKNLDCGSN